MRNDPATQKRRAWPLFVFLFLAFVMWCTPLSSDDFEFATRYFPDLRAFLRYVLYYGNGRVLGNITSIVMCKLPLVGYVLKAFVLTAIIYLLPRVLGLNGLKYDLISFLLILGVNPVLFGEVYTWNCGFANYMPPIFCALFIIFLIQKYPELKNNLKIVVCLLIFALGIAAQLFVEHTTVINVLLALIFVIKERKKKSLVPSLIWLAASVLGAAVMLLIPKLFFLENNRTGNYRAVHFGSASDLLETCADNAILLLNGCVGTFGLLLSGGAMLTLHQTRKQRSEKLQKILFAVAAICFGFVLFNSLFHSDAMIVDFNYNGLIMPAVYEYFYRIASAIVTYCALGVWVYAAWDNKTVRTLLLLAASSMIIMLPVTPAPTRVVFQPYLLTASAFMLVVPKLKNKAWTRGLCAACCALTLSLGLTFLSCRQMAQARDAHIRNELRHGAETIEVFEIPTRYVYWDSVWSMKEYYAPDRAVSFTEIDYSLWQGKYVLLDMGTK